jgi:uncharacterized protein DUF2784
MKKISLTILANFIFLFHCAILLVVFFGWLVPALWPVYIAVLIVTLGLDIVLGYCILSKWEFQIRKKLNPHLNYDYSFSSFYTYKLTRKRIPERFVETVGVIFIVFSLCISLYFHFL